MKIILGYNLKKGEELILDRIESKNLKGNESLVKYYSRFYEGNIYDSTDINLHLSSILLTKQKNDILIEKGIINPNNNFRISEKPKEYIEKVTLYPNKILNEILVLMRLYNYELNSEGKNENIEKRIIDRLTSGYWYSFQNEISSLSNLRFSILNGNINKAILKLQDIIQSLELTSKYFDNSEGNFDDDLNYDLNLLYRRKNILETIRNSVGIFHKNIFMINHKVDEVVSDQLLKLKNFYLNEEN